MLQPYSNSGFNRLKVSSARTNSPAGL